MREVAALEAAAQYCEQQGLPLSKELRSLYDKITRPAPKVMGSNVAGIEHELVSRSNGRVLAAQGGPPFWIQQSRKYADMQATVEDAILVGDWLGRQTWLRQTYTIQSLAWKWPDYLAKAKAEANKTEEPSGWTRQDWSDQPA